MGKTLKLQRSETFYIREGWIEKILMSYRNDSKGVFSKKMGSLNLGIGSNMVKSLKYWVDACGLVIFNKDVIELTHIGSLINTNDPYMETLFSWGLIHYQLAKNKENAPVFYAFFNHPSWKNISRKDSVQDFEDYFLDEGYSDINTQSLQKDIATLISSYYNDDNEDKTPEQNISCPLARLGLLTKKSRDCFEKKNIAIENIDYRLLYICLKERYKDDFFNTEDAMTEEESPALVFNIDRDVFLTLILQMKKENLIDLNRTAGLNTVYFKSEKSDAELFAEYMAERNKRGV